MNTAPFYFITFDGMVFGRRATGIYEIDCDRMTIEQIARGIVEGQYEDIDRVYEAIPGGTCSDITYDIAEEVFSLVWDQDFGVTSDNLRNWLARHLGDDVLQVTTEREFA